MKFKKSGINIRQLIFLVIFHTVFNGCLFETSSCAFDGEITAVTLVKHDEKTATYSIKYNGWSTVDSLGVFVKFESCKINARFLNNQWKTLCYPNLQSWGSEKAFPIGRFEGVENVTWTLNRDDTAYVQLEMFAKPRGAIGFSRKVLVEKQF